MAPRPHFYIPGSLWLSLVRLTLLLIESVDHILYLELVKNSMHSKDCREPTYYSTTYRKYVISLIYVSRNGCIVLVPESSL